MKTFLELLEPKLPATQAQRIAAIVAQKQRQGELRSSTEITDEVARLLQLVRRSEDFEPAFQVREIRSPRDRIESDAINGAMEELDLDLRTLYEVTNQLTSTGRSLQKVLKHQLESLRAGICRLTDDLIAARLQKANQFARVVTQGFADGRNMTEGAQKAVIDPQTRSLKLDETHRTRYHQRRGVNPAQVVVRSLSSGLSGVVSRTFQPENAIDPDTESFWAEVLLTDAPIQTTYTFVDGSEQTYDGALVEVGLILGVPDFVTDVKILPFGQYPLDVIDIKFRQGDAWFQYPGFVDRAPALNWLEWHGPRVQADEVAFVLHQANYERRRFHIPTRLLHLANFWEQLLDEETQLTLSNEVLTQFQQQRADADGHFRSLHEGLARYGLEIDRLDLPGPDPESRVFSESVALGKEIDAAEEAMLADPRNQQIRLSHLGADSTPPPGLTEIERIEYIFGAREIQANDVGYVNQGAYASPKYAADSTLLTLRLNTDEEHPVFNVGEGNFRQTSIEYEIELAPGRRAPLLPKDVTTVQDELLDLDRTTRQDTTRFPAASSTVTVRRSGKKLGPGDFSVATLSSGQLRITIARSAFFRTARYTVTYTPATDSDLFDVDALYDSVVIDRPEIFPGTDETGAVELRHYPYVEYGVINNATLFKREATRSARYFWIGGAQQVFLDGIMYGDVNVKLAGAISSTATTITLNSVLGLQSPAGKLRIENEIITYTGISSNDLTGVTRGVDGTQAQAHAALTPIVGERAYEPLVVTVGNIKARNITDYLSGEHPAFLAASDDTLCYEFLHIGRRLFFNRPISDNPITVRYRWMSQYIQVHALLRSHTVGRVPQTPVLHRYHLEIASTVL